MFDLLDYRRRVADLYRLVREDGANPAVWQYFCQQRDDLFRSHPQSPLDDLQKAVFVGVPYYDYNPVFRVTVPLHPAESHVYEIDLGEDGAFKMRRFAYVDVDLPTGSGRLYLYWIMGYGGGVFLPFGDITNRDTTYGAGRYLYDTIKGADLGTADDNIILDFNYAYHPSCAYNPRWVCPLAPPENKLPFPIPAGEKLMNDAS